MRAASQPAEEPRVRHLTRIRILEVVRNDLRLEPNELDHVEKCTECFKRFSQLILEVARQKAQQKKKDAVR